MSFHQHKKSPEQVEALCQRYGAWTICPDVPLTRRKAIHCLYNPDAELVLQHRDLGHIMDWLRENEVENVCFRAPFLQHALFARILTTVNHLKKGSQDG